MIRTDVAAVRVLAFVGMVASAAACSSAGSGSTSSNAAGTDSACGNGVRDGDEVGVDCGGQCPAACTGSSVTSGSSGSSGSSSGNPAGGIDGVKDGSETDVDCGGPSAPKCVDGQSCLVDSDCPVVCNYAKRCIGTASCKPHLGGDTCGIGEVGEPGTVHESCCRTLKVPGYTDPTHAGQTVYLDKYEITAGRIRSFVEQMAISNGGKPDVKSWIAKHRPPTWDPAWEAFLPSDLEGGALTIARRLLGDPRPEDAAGGGVVTAGPGVILPPPTDQVRQLGTNFQFGAEIYVDLHGNDCATYAGSYGFPTFYYPPAIVIASGQVPRTNGVGFGGQVIAAQELLDVKAMNCITNAMLAAFCAWDGGQLATTAVLDFVTDTPASLGNVSGCGLQIDDHGKLLGNVFSGTVQSGGRCAPVALVNATFDAGDALPVQGSPLNTHNYHYPDTGSLTSDKAWEIAAPGRASLANGQQADVVRINAGDEPWMDLAGNLSEAALDVSGGTFTGHFALKYRGIGYGSSRSDLNVSLMAGESILRVQRPEAKAAYSGGRCMRFK